MSCSPDDSWLVEYVCHWAIRVITAYVVAVVVVHYFVDVVVVVVDVFVVEVPERFCVVDERAAVVAAVVVDLAFVVKSEFQYLQ